jgi:hypothetical protein
VAEAVVYTLQTLVKMDNLADQEVVVVRLLADLLVLADQEPQGKEIMEVLATLAHNMVAVAVAVLAQ